MIVINTISIFKLLGFRFNEIEERKCEGKCKSANRERKQVVWE